jgi:DNA replication and repair protein RecF
MPNLAVEKLSISHFRSHRALEVSCDPRPLAIYGANGVGKTNILEAVSLLSPGRGVRRAAAADMVRKPENLGWKIKAVIRLNDHISEIETWSENGSARQVRIDDKAVTQLALGKIVRVLWLIPAMDRLWTDAAEGRRRFLDRMTLSFDSDHAENVLIYEKAMRERNRLLKNQIRDEHWYKVIESQMAKAAVKIWASRYETLKLVDEAQEWSETLFPSATLKLINAEDVEVPSNSEDLAELLSQYRKRDIVAGRTLLGPHRDDLYGIFLTKNIPAKDSSTGEQKALLISLILANCRALKRQTGITPLLLLDEVSAHLDAGRRSTLYDEICDLGAQAWLTGTGPELFDDLGNRAQHLLAVDKGGKSSVLFQ